MCGHRRAGRRRVEEHEQGLEIALPRGGEKSVHELSLPARVDVGERRGSSHPAPGTARELSRRRRRAFDDRRDLVEGHGEHVMKHEGEPLGRSDGVEHHEQRQADGVREQRLVLGSTPSTGLTIGSSTCWSNNSSCRDLRDLRVLRHTRATIVVSHPRRFSIPHCPLG
jgi:hypothetical protein